MHPTLTELIVTDHAAQLLREAEEERLARRFPSRKRSQGGLVAGALGVLKALRPRPRPGRPVAPAACA
jgi:hypothetical protein